ncbi:hypothetical protein LTR53_018870, partial [Teratosphaeriaceae sp. CCFEE 6253]
MQAAVPGAAARRVESSDGVAWVYDIDAVTTWRIPDERAFETALARGTISVAIESFVDAYPGIHPCSTTALLHRFRDYVLQLGTQPVTLPLSSLVDDMLAAYDDLGPSVAPFSCAPDVTSFVQQFVRSRECFFRGADRMPWLEVTFAGCE